MNPNNSTDNLELEKTKLEQMKLELELEQTKLELEQLRLESVPKPKKVNSNPTEPSKVQKWHHNKNIRGFFW